MAETTLFESFNASDIELTYLAINDSGIRFLFVQKLLKPWLSIILRLGMPELMVLSLFI